jgi:branched-chain amino acid transport system permease protein
MVETFHPSHWQVQTPRVGIWVLCVAALALAVVPWFAQTDTLRLLVEVMALVAMAQAWNLLAGFTGFVSVGQQAFIGIGAYALFLFAIHLSVSPFAAVLLGGLMGMAVGAVAAPALFHLRGPTFAIGTWVLAELFRIAITNTAWLGGASGLTLARVVRGVPLQERTRLTYWLALAVAVLAVGGLYGLLRSRLGLAIRTVRDNEASAQSVGVDVAGVKRLVFVLAAFVTGCAGAVVYLNTMFVTSTAAFAVDWSALIIFVVIVGGIGTVEGPIVGALLYFGLREWLADYGTWYIIALGLIAIATMVWAPQGLWGTLSRRWRISLFPVTALVRHRSLRGTLPPRS